MHFTKKLLAQSVAAMALIGSVAPAVNAEVGAAVGIGNMYYWRGLDLGNGNAAVWGDLNFSEGGFYAGIWGSSGDFANGTEYDLYIGYGGEAGDLFTYDISLWSYQYPSATSEEIVFSGTTFETSSEDASPEIGDLMEIVGSIGIGPVALTYYHGIQDFEDYWYANISYGVGDYSISYGLHETDYAHIDLGYAYNDNLSFTLGLPVDDADDAFDDDIKFVVGYSLPLEM